MRTPRQWITVGWSLQPRSGIRTQQVHHTEYWMPESGLLFANDHMAGRTVVMDVRDPLHPRVRASFGDIGGFSHPHSFLRLPNGHVLASFQVEGHMDHETHTAVPATDVAPAKGVHGGIVEMDDEGRLVLRRRPPIHPDGTTC